MAGVKVKFDGDKTQLEQAYRDLAAQHAKLENQVAKLGATSAKSSQQTVKGQSLANEAMRAGVSQAAELASSFLSIGAAVNSASMDMEEFRKIQAEALKQQAGVGQGQSKLVQALAGKSKQEVQAVFDEIAKIQRDTKFSDINQLYEATAAAYSANGGDVQQAIATARASAPIARNSPQDIKDIAQGASTLGRALPHLSPEERIALTNSMGGPSYITNPGQQARWMPSSVAQAMSGFDLRTQEERDKAANFFGAYFAAQGSMAGDTEGASTATDTTDYANELREFFTKGVEKTINGRKFRIRYGEGQELRTPDQMQEFLWNNPEAAQAFNEMTTAEGKYRLGRETMILGGQGREKFQEFRPQIRADVEDYNSMKTMQESGTRELQVATSQATQEALQQQRQLANAVGAREAQARAIRDKTLSETREYSKFFWGSRTFAESVQTTASDYGGEDPFVSAERALSQREREIRSKSSWLKTIDSSPLKTDSELTAKERKDLDYIRAQREELRRAQQERDAYRAEEKQPSAAGGALLQAIQEQTRLAAQQSEKQVKATEENTSVTRELSQQLRTRYPAGDARAQYGTHQER